MSGIEQPRRVEIRIQRSNQALPIPYPPNSQFGEGNFGYHPIVNNHNLIDQIPELSSPWF